MLFLLTPPSPRQLKKLWSQQRNDLEEVPEKKTRDACDGSVECKNRL